MPSPSQIRAMRVSRLADVAEALLERGVPSHLLFGKLWALARRSWPAVREPTLRDYVSSSIRTVLSRPLVDSDILPETVSPQEAK